MNCKSHNLEAIKLFKSVWCCLFATRSRTKLMRHKPEEVGHMAEDYEDDEYENYEEED